MSSDSRPDVSVVIPAYNERESLPLLHARLREVLDRLGRSYQILFVDDGSTDRSMEVLEALHAADPHVAVIQLRKNSGKSAALQVGFQAAQGNVVLTMDADLQDDPKEIPRFLEKIGEGYDLVSGWKAVRRDPLSKTLPSKLFNRVASLMTGIPIHDFNCGFKAYTAEAVRDVSLYGELHRYIPVLLHRKGYTVAEIKVEHHARKFGKSKYGLERFLRGFLDLLTVLFLTRYLKKPLHLFGSLGLVTLLSGVVINVYLSVLWFQGTPIGRRPLLMLGVLLCVTGIQFISIGLLGEMITESSHRNSTYPVRKVLGLLPDQGGDH